MSDFDLAPDIQRWIADGKHDVGRWAANGLGIHLHDKQLSVMEELETGDHLFHFLWWANRVGKSLGVIIWHLHGIYYKPELAEPTTEHEQELWQAEDYRTLHTAPLGLLATRAFNAIREISRGTHPAQRDEQGKRREAPLGPNFSPAKERDAAGADHMVVRSTNGGTMDFFSTEGGALRLESMAWRRISWDEWPAQEAADKGTAIRSVLMRLQNRASDFDAKILLTGTITPETEHIAQEWIDYCEDPEDPDWWGSTASRRDNPYASLKAIERAMRTMDPEDIARVIDGTVGGVKGRVLPPFMLSPAFTKELPRFSPPHPLDGAHFEELPSRVERSRPRRTEDEELPPVRGRFRPRSTLSPYTYLHLWDLAIAAAENAGIVLRIPADWKFGWTTVDGRRVLRAIEGVQMKIIPGSRTLTDDEIIHTIEETFLPYGGLIVVDSTDAHGKNIHRKLRRAGYPVEGFVFNERTVKGVIRKDDAIEHLRELLVEGMDLKRDARGEMILDPDGVPIFNRDVPYGVIRMPADWKKPHDQLSVLKVDNSRQTKDAAMAVLMGGDVAYRTRRSRTRRATTTRLAVFAGGRRFGEGHDGRRSQRA